MRRSDTNAKETRYQIVSRRFEGKMNKALIRVDLAVQKPNQLFIIRGLRKKIRHLQEPKHPKNKIYLDGACDGPHLDVKRKIFSLDHHGDCIRPFTMATCEQALMLARDRKIESTGYKIIANDPDLDTVLAAWALMHADHIRYREDVFRKMCPIFLLEGNIDRHGFGYEELVMPDQMIREVRKKILWLSAEERDLKKRQRWDTVDFVEYAERIFQKINEYAFYHEEPEEEVSIQSQETETLPNGETVLFVRSSEGGIYGAIHELITKTKDNQCVCAVWTDGNNRWTIKTTGLITPYNLKPVFKRLAQEEQKAKRAKGVTDPELLKTNWGGCGNIGGQPRYYDGTGPFIDSPLIKNIVMEELAKQI